LILRHQVQHEKTQPLQGFRTSCSLYGTGTVTFASAAQPATYC